MDTQAALQRLVDAAGESEDVEAVDAMRDLLIALLRGHPVPQAGSADALDTSLARVVDRLEAIVWE